MHYIYITLDFMGFKKKKRFTKYIHNMDTGYINKWNAHVREDNGRFDPFQSWIRVGFTMFKSYNKSNITIDTAISTLFRFEFGLDFQWWNRVELLASISYQISNGEIMLNYQRRFRIRNPLSKSITAISTILSF
jgi:hypothetical protein